MTTLYESPIDREADIEALAHCLGTIIDLQCDFPNEQLDDSRLPQEIQNGLEELQRVTSWLVYQGAEALWEYAKARGLADDIATMAEAGKLPCHNWGETNTHVRELTWNWQQ